MFNLHQFVTTPRQKNKTFRCLRSNSTCHESRLYRWKSQCREWPIDFVISSKLRVLLSTRTHATHSNISPGRLPRHHFWKCSRSYAQSVERSSDRASEWARCVANPIEQLTCWRFRANFSAVLARGLHGFVKIDVSVVLFGSKLHRDGMPNTIDVNKGRKILSSRISLNDDSRAWNSIKPMTILHSYPRWIKSRHTFATSRHLTRNALNFEESIHSYLPAVSNVVFEK